MYLRDLIFLYLCIFYFFEISRRLQNGKWRCCLYVEMELSLYVCYYISFVFRVVILTEVFFNDKKKGITTIENIKELPQCLLGLDLFNFFADGLPNFSPLSLMHDFRMKVRIENSMIKKKRWYNPCIHAYHPEPISSVSRDQIFFLCYHILLQPCDSEPATWSTFAFSIEWTST